MPLYEFAMFVIRPAARAQAERAMNEYANYVRAQLPDSTWTTYRDPAAPASYMTLTVLANAAARQRHRSAPGTQAFLSALDPLLDGAIELTECQLVTSSDLGRGPMKPR